VLLPASAFLLVFPGALVAMAPEPIFSPVLLVVAGTADGPVGLDGGSPGRLGVVLLTVSPTGG
jgi:hypothetical protein